MSAPYTRLSVIPSAKGTTGIRYIEYSGADYTAINAAGLTAIDTYFVAVSTGKLVVQGGSGSWRIDLGSEYELVKLQFSFNVPVGVTIKCYSTDKTTKYIITTTTTGTEIDLRVSPTTIGFPSSSQTDPYFTQSVRARYVRVENPGLTLIQWSSDVNLLFSQLALYDIHNRNVAMAKPTSDSTSTSPTAQTSAIVSGASNSSYSGSTTLPGAWWEVDLGKEYSLWKFQFTSSGSSAPMVNVPIVFYSSQRQETARKFLHSSAILQEYILPPQVVSLPHLNLRPLLSLWLDASDVNGTGVQPPFGAITTWVDKSGSGNNATTIAGANVSYNRTDSVTGSIRFSSTPYAAPTNGGMSLPDGTLTSGSNSFTIFIVHMSAQPNVWTGTIFSADEAGTAGNSIRLYCESPYREGKLGFIPFTTTTNLGDMYTTTPISTSNKTVICVTYDSTTRVVQLYMNGNTDLSYTYTSSVTTWSPYNHFIGQDIKYKQPLDGSIHEVIGFNTVALNTQTRKDIEVYLMKKWAIFPTGMTLWLDASDVNGNGVQPSAGPLTTWKDKSGAGNNATTMPGAIVTYAPILSGSATGSILFVPDPTRPRIGGMQLPNGTLTRDSNSFTIFTVFTSARPGSMAGSIISADELNASANSFRVYCEHFVGKIGVVPYATTNNLAEVQTQTTTSTTFSNRTLLTITYNSSTRVLQVYVNGNTDVSYTYTNSVTAWSAANHLIANSDQYKQPLYGSIYEIVGFNSTLLPTESRRLVETYLTNKWGVSSARLIRYIQVYSLSSNLTFKQFAAVDSRGINVAVGKVTCGLFYNTTTTTTTADTTPTAGATYYYNAVNGRFDSRYVSSAAGTSIQNVVWWLDLGKACQLNSIIFYNDVTNSTTQANAATYTLNVYDQNHIKVFSKSPGALTTSYKQILDVRSVISGPPADIVPVSGIGVKTRYVRLVRNGTIRISQLIAVDSLGRNVALGKTWSGATSSNSTNGAIAPSANYDTVSSTATLDLGEEHEIIYIVAYGGQTTPVIQPSATRNIVFDSNLANASCLLLDGASNTVAIQPIFNFQVDLSGIILDYTAPQSTLDTGSTSVGCITNTIPGAFNQPLIVQGATRGQYAFSADQFVLPNTFALTMQLGLNGAIGVGYLGLTSAKSASYTGGAGSPWSDMTSYVFKVSGLTGQAMVSGVPQGPVTTITASSILQIIYDGDLILFLIDGVIVYTSAYSVYTSFIPFYFGAYFGTWNNNMTVSVFNTKPASVDITAAANDLAVITWKAAAVTAASCARIYDLKCINPSKLTLAESTFSIRNLQQNATNLVANARTQVNTTIPGYISTMQGYYDDQTYRNIMTANFNILSTMDTNALFLYKFYTDTFLPTLYRIQNETNSSLGEFGAELRGDFGDLKSRRSYINAVIAQCAAKTPGNILVAKSWYDNNVVKNSGNRDTMNGYLTNINTCYSNINTLITRSTTIQGQATTSLNEAITIQASINTYITNTVNPLVTTYTNVNTTITQSTVNQLTAQQNYSNARTALSTLKSTETSLLACLSTLIAAGYNTDLIAKAADIDAKSNTIRANLGTAPDVQSSTSAYAYNLDVGTHTNNANLALPDMKKAYNDFIFQVTNGQTNWKMYTPPVLNSGSRIDGGGVSSPFTASITTVMDYFKDLQPTQECRIA